jgi:hypothetical protein
VYPSENRGAVIDIVFSLPQIEVGNGDGDNFFDIGVGPFLPDVLGDRFGSAIQQPVKLVVLVAVLHFDDDQFSFSIFHKQINAVELVVLVLFVALAIEDLFNFDLLAEQLGQEPLQYVEVNLVPEQPFYRPVKLY